MDERQRAQEIRRLEERIEALRGGMAGTREREVAGELGDYGQHQADQATEMADRERTLGDIEALERRLHRLRTGERPEDLAMPPSPDQEEEEGPVRTPLDEPAPREDLSAIPMAGDRPADAVADPQEDSGEPEMDMPGAVYRGEGGAPEVGRRDEDDEELRDYRPRD